MSQHHGANRRRLIFYLNIVAHSRRNSRRSPNAGSMLARRLRRRANIEPTLGERLVFAGALMLSCGVTLPLRQWLYNSPLNHYDASSMQHQRILITLSSQFLFLEFYGAQNAVGKKDVTPLPCRRVDIPHDLKKNKTKGFSTVFYPTGYSQWPKQVYQNLTHKNLKSQDGRH